MIIPIVIGIIQIHKLNKYLLLLFALVVCSFLSDLLVHYNREWRYFIWSILSILDFLILSTIFFFSSKNTFKRELYFSGLLLFFIYSIFYFFIFQNLQNKLPDIRAITLFTFLIISTASFIELYNNIEHENLFLFPFFWINVAVLIYFSGNLFLIISYNIFTMEKVYQLYTPIHNTLNTVKNLLFAAAFFVYFLNSRRKNAAS